MKINRSCVTVLLPLLLGVSRSLSAQTLVGAGVGGSRGFENFIKATTPLTWHLVAERNLGERRSIGVAFTRLESPFVVKDQPDLIPSSSIAVLTGRGHFFLSERHSPVRVGALGGFGWMLTRLRTFNSNVGKTNQPTIELGGVLQSDNTRRVIGRFEGIYTRPLTQYSSALNASGPAYWTVSGGLSLRVGR